MSVAQERPLPTERATGDCYAWPDQALSCALVPCGRGGNHGSTKQSRFGSVPSSRQRTDARPGRQLVHEERARSEDHPRRPSAQAVAGGRHDPALSEDRVLVGAPLRGRRRRLCDAFHSTRKSLVSGDFGPFLRSPGRLIEDRCAFRAAFHVFLGLNGCLQGRTVVRPVPWFDHGAVGFRMGREWLRCPLQP